MRIRLTSGILPRLALAGTVLCALPGAASAWDEDRIQNELQPYFGVWAGLYMVDTKDLRDLGSEGAPSELSKDHFSSARPAFGGSLGVAYGRLHVGLNGGYQVMNGYKYPYSSTVNVAGTRYPILSSDYYYRYQVIPLDLGIDVALLPNETPINLFVGGSAGIGLVGMQLPWAGLAKTLDSAHTQVSLYTNDWNWSNYLLSTLYVGARINLARRLNLEGQIGYRFLTSDEVELGHGEVLVRPGEYSIVDSSGARKLTDTKNIPINMSSFYLRIDARWTFASGAERDESRAAQRAQRMREILAMAPAHLQRLALTSN